MKTISIQAEYGYDDEFNKAFFLQKLDELNIAYELVENPEGVNAYISTDDVNRTWLKIESSLLSNSCIARSCSVVVEGNSGWDDLVFLHSNE